MDNLLGLLELIKITLSDIYPYFNDEDITEIMLNNDGYIYLDRVSTGLEKTEHQLPFNKALNLIKILADSTNKIINAKNPIISTTFPTGERFEGLISPVVDSPVFSIRKPSIHNFSLEDYKNKGSMTKKQLLEIQNAIKKRKNILVIGGTGTGKTTLCNAIIKEMKNLNERIITIEDTKELRVENENIVSLITSNECNTRVLLRSSMRLRPDRICLGEVRGAEALNLLKAWNSGHNGGVCTIHSNTCESGLEQLEQYILEVSSSPQKFLIGSSIDILINIKRSNNKRYIDKILQLDKYDNKLDCYIFKDIS